MLSGLLPFYHRNIGVTRLELATTRPPDEHSTTELHPADVMFSKHCIIPQGAAMSSEETLDFFLYGEKISLEELICIEQP